MSQVFQDDAKHLDDTSLVRCRSGLSS